MEPNQTAITLEQPLSDALLPQSPALPGGRPAISIRLLPATRKGVPTIAMVGAVDLTRRQSLLYGPDARQVLRIVAFEPRAGQLYHADFAGAHAAGLGPMSRFNPPDPPKAPSGAVLPVGFGFNFVVDLVSVLDLPGDAARYTVVAWIEDLVSEARAINVPAAKTRLPARPRVPDVFALAPDHLAATTLSPPRRKNGLSAKAAPLEAEPERRIGRVFASVGQGVFLPTPPGQQNPPPRHLAVLAQTALDRRLAMIVLRLPPTLLDAAAAGEFDFEVADLFPKDTRRQPVFVTLLAGEQVSEALTIVPPGFRD